MIDDEIAGALTRVCDGMPVDDEGLALELIEKTGPGGGFMGTRYTLEHLRRDVWVPRLAGRNIADNWVKLGSRDMRQNAREMVLQILSEHSVTPIEEE